MNEPNDRTCANAPDDAVPLDEGVEPQEPQGASLASRILRSITSTLTFYRTTGCADGFSGRMRRFGFPSTPLSLSTPLLLPFPGAVGCAALCA